MYYFFPFSDDPCHVLHSEHHFLQGNQGIMAQTNIRPSEQAFQDQLLQLYTSTYQPCLDCNPFGSHRLHSTQQIAGLNLYSPKCQPRKSFLMTKNVHIQG